jgi:hypothetical protein
MHTSFTPTCVCLPRFLNFASSIPRSRSWSRRVRHVKLLAGILGAKRMATRQFVFAGLATTTTRTLRFAKRSRPSPCWRMMGTLRLMRSARVMPSLRGNPPNKIATSTSRNACAMFTSVDYWCICVVEAVVGVVVVCACAYGLLTCCTSVVATTELRHGNPLSKASKARKRRLLE